MIVLVKIIKKIVAATAAAAITVSCAASIAFADNSAGLEAAILSVKSRIEVPAELTEFDSNVNNTEDGTEYSLSWRQDSGDNLRVSVNDKNDITYYRYYRQDNNERTIKFAKYTNEQLLDKAYEWLAEINPGWIAELPRENAVVSERSDIYGGEEYISLRRYVNGIPFLFDSVSVSVSNRTGEVIGMSATWDYEQNIPDPSEAMDEAKAAEEFFKLSELELKYEGSGEGNSATLVYSPKNPWVRINARKGGEINEYAYNDYDKEQAVAEDAAVSMAAGGSSNRKAQLSESEILNINEVKGLLSKEELVKKAQALYNTGLDKAAFESCEYRRTPAFMPFKNGETEEKESYTANLRFMFNKGTEKQTEAHVEFDAQSGELISYRAWNYYDYLDSDVAEKNAADKKPAVSYDKAEAEARKFAEQNAPEQLAKTKVVEKSEERYGSDYTISFVRHENDIPFYSDSINISVNSETGRIQSYRKNWTEDITFESTDGVLDEAGAKAKFNENIGYNLSYVYSYEKGKNEPNVELAYTVSDKGNKINAKTGDVISSNTEKAVVYPDDISGHYAEKQINALIENGILELGDEASFRPDDAVTQKELAEMVGKLTQRYYYASEDISALARSMGIIGKSESIDSDTPATRADGPKYIIRALGYREVAELSDTFACGFTDSDSIAPELLGYAAIAKGMGIIKGDENGCFNPNDALTRADAAIMIYNYLAR